MTRPLKDRETGEPAQNISLTLTRPRLEWLRELAARRNTSVSSAVEHLIDQARGSAQGEDLVLKAAIENLSHPLEVRVAAPSPNITAHADLALAKRVDPKAHVDPHAEDEPSKRKYVEPRLKKGGAK